MEGDEGLDVALEVPDGVVNAAPDLFFGEQAEPSFDLVDPRSPWRRSARRTGRACRCVYSHVCGAPRCAVYSSTSCFHCSFSALIQFSVNVKCPGVELKDIPFYPAAVAACPD